MAKQNNELLMKNHETHPSGLNPPPEVNAARYDNQNSGSGRGHGRGHGRGRGCGYGHGRDRGNYSVQFKNTGNFNKRQERGDKDKGEIDETKSACHRCGGRSHWACNCRTLKYLVDLYQESLEKKNKKMETNFASGSGDNIFDDNIFSATDIGEYDHNTSTHLDVSDFFIQE